MKAESEIKNPGRQYVFLKNHYRIQGKMPLFFELVEVNKNLILHEKDILGSDLFTAANEVCKKAETKRARAFVGAAYKDIRKRIC